MANNTAPEWPQEKLRSLMMLAKDGYSAREIGERLGYSKNAVIGKAHRNKIEVGISSALGVLQSRRFGRKKKAPDEDMPPRQPIPDRGRCQWPLGDAWCGCPAEGVYCPEHYSMAFTGRVALTEAEIKRLILG